MWSHTLADNSFLWVCDERDQVNAMQFGQFLTKGWLQRNKEEDGTTCFLG
jgi:hypothetical protein